MLFTKIMNSNIAGFKKIMNSNIAGFKKIMNSKIAGFKKQFCDNGLRYNLKTS